MNLPITAAQNRPQAKTLLLQEQIEEVLGQWRPMGVRAIGYVLINRYQDRKGERYPKDDSFFQIVERATKFMRFSGRIAWDWIIDETRELEAKSFWCDPQELLDACAAQYRIDLWEDQDRECLVLCEKHGLTGVLREATRDRRVTFATLGGSCGLSLARDILRWIAERADRTVRIFYLGDYDPTGVQIHKWLWTAMYVAAPTVVPDYPLDHYVRHVTVERLAVNSLAQARTYGGISRETKLENNNHSEAWLKMLAETGRPADEESVEVDSIPPETLQAMVSEAIETTIDQELWELALEREAEERERFSRARLPN